MRSMTRRDVLRTMGLGGAALAVSGMSPLTRMAFAAPETFTGVTYLTPAYKALMYGVNGFLDQVKKRPDDVKVDFFDSATLIKVDEQIPAMRAGTIQFMFHTTSYITRSFPILGITGLPGTCTELFAHGERFAMESPLWKLINDQLAKENMFMLTAGGGIMEPEFVWSHKLKLENLGDLNGKRCRVVSYEATEALKSFGVAGVRIPSSETYLALQRGTVDAMVGNISTIVGRKLYEQIKYCYKLPVTAFTISVFFLKDKWDKMGTKEKAAFWEAGKWCDENYAKTVNKKYYVDEYWPLLKKEGVESAEPNAEELKQFAEKSQPIWKWWKDQVGEEVGQKALDLAMGKA